MCTYFNTASTTTNPHCPASTVDLINRCRQHANKSGHGSLPDFRALGLNGASPTALRDHLHCRAGLSVCGHLQCQDCCAEGFNPATTEPSCFLCARKLFFSRCGHRADTVEIPSSVPLLTIRIALTMTEGGQLPRRCNTCLGEALLLRPYEDAMVVSVAWAAVGCL